MFDSENGSTNSQLTNGIAEMLKQNRVYGPAPIASSPTAQSLGSMAAERAAVRSPITVLQEQQAQYGVPSDPKEPKYRMGTGQRILGTLANFANGFAGKGGSPVYVGPGALNNRYYQDEALRRENLKNVTRQLAEQHHVGPDTTGTTENFATELQDESGQQPDDNTDFPTGHWQPLQTTPLTSGLPRTEARARFASLRNARTQPDYRMIARHPESNQRIGSHDGQNWEFIPEEAESKQV